MKRILLLTVFLVAVAVQQQAEAQLRDFDGRWKNVNRRTRGIPKLEITVDGLAVTLHVFGACSPTDCDWGSVPALPYGSTVSSDLNSSASALTAEYDFGFSEIRVVIHRVSRMRLKVETFDHFKDGSDRSDYHHVSYFRPLKKNEPF